MANPIEDYILQINDAVKILNKRIDSYSAVVDRLTEFANYPNSNAKEEITVRFITEDGEYTTMYIDQSDVWDHIRHYTDLVMKNRTKLIAEYRKIQDVIEDPLYGVI